MTFLQSLKKSVSRIYVVYIIFALFVIFLWHTPAIMRNAVSQTLSRLTPPINYFKEFVDRKPPYDKYKLTNCVYYHDKIAYFFPYQAPEANSMLGFCYYRLGKNASAIKAYQRSLELNPVYFWSYYNLGVISYKNKEYPQAYAYFRNATQQDMIKSMLIISQSKVYSDVINSDSKVAEVYNVESSVREGNSRAFIGVMMTLFKAEKYGELLRFAIKNAPDKGDNSSVYYYFAGLAAFNLKVYDKAAVLFEKTISLDNLNADAYLYLGLCLRAGGREDLALEYLTKARRIHEQQGSLIEKLDNIDVQLF